MIRKIAFTMYPVSDIARARAFYKDVLGLKECAVGSRGANYWVEYDLPGGGCLAINNFTGGKPSDASGGTLGLEVRDLEQLMDDLQAKGVRFRTGIIDSPLCRMAICLDSEGNSLLLHQHKSG